MQTKTYQVSHSFADLHAKIKLLRYLQNVLKKAMKHKLDPHRSEQILEIRDGNKNSKRLKLEYFHFVEFILNLVKTPFQNVRKMYLNIFKKQVFLLTSIERSKLSTSVSTPASFLHITQLGSIA